MKSIYQRGAQIIEFALVLPFFLIVLFLVVDFGFVVYNKAVITNASREAARAATVLTATPWSIANVKTVACNYTRDSLINTKSGTRNAACTGTADPVIVVSNVNGNVPPHFNDPITVRVTYAYSGFLLNRLNDWISNTSFPDLVASSTMNHE